MDLPSIDQRYWTRLGFDSMRVIRSQRGRYICRPRKPFNASKTLAIYCQHRKCLDFFLGGGNRCEAWCHKETTSQECEKVPRRARIEGSYTLVSLNSRLERNNVEEEVTKMMHGRWWL